MKRIATRFELDQEMPANAEQELNQVLLALLKPAAVFVLLLHVLLILTYPLQNGWPLWGQRVAITGSTAIIVATGYMLIARDRIRPQTVHLFAATFLALPIVADTFGNYYLTRDPLLLSYFLISAVIFGYFALDRRWLLFVEIFNALVAAAAIRITGTAFNLTPYVPILLGALVAAAFLHIAHRTSLLRMIALRQREGQARRVAENLQRSGAALTSRLQVGDVLEAVLTNLTTVLECDRASVLLRQDDYLEITASRGFPAGVNGRPAGRIHLGDAAPDGIFPQIVHNRATMHLADVSERPDWVSLPAADPARTWLGVPLLGDDDILGLLSLVRVTPRPFSQDEINSAEIFANQAAVALQNARLYEQVSQFNQTLEAEVKNRTNDLQAAYDRLEKLDQAKSDFINIMSHEIRTPLTVLRGYIQMLARDRELWADTRASSYVDGINMGSLRLQELVDSLLIMVKIDNGTLETAWTEFAVVDLVKIVIGDLYEIFDSRSQTVHLDPSLNDLPPIVADYDLLQKVMNNLLLNGVKYMPDGGRMTISGCPKNGRIGEEEMPGVEIVFTDTGIGVPAEMQELIFTKFFQTGKIDLHSSGKVKFKGGGAGLGLSIARGIIDLHHGRIWVESEGQDEDKLPGSQFHIWIPRSPPG